MRIRTGETGADAEKMEGGHEDMMEMARLSDNARSAADSWDE